ncbi:MAG: GntR family transcriptional regulator [Actinomycetota bacterium]
MRSSESLFLTEAEQQTGSPGRRLLEVGVGYPPDHFAEFMGARTPVIIRRRLMTIDGVPVRIANSYFPAQAPEADDLLGDGFIDGGLQKLFESHGRRFGHARETLTARAATSQEAEVLELGSTDPVVQIIRTSFDAQGEAVHTLETICAATRHVFVVTQLPGDTAF